MSNNSSLLEGYITYQVRNNGQMTDQRMDSIMNSKTPSRRFLEKQLDKLKKMQQEAELSKEENSSAPNDDDASKKEELHSTTTIHFTVETDQALLMLNEIDQEKDTPEFTKKFERFREVKQRVGNLQQLPLSMKIEAINQLNSVGFISYSWQVYIKIPGMRDKNGKPVYATSKRHNRLQSMSVESVKDKLNPFHVKWLSADGKSTDSNSSSNS